MIAFLIVVFALGLLLLGIVSAAPKSQPKGRRRGGRSIDKELIAMRWEVIEQTARNGGAVGVKSAVSEADKLFDYVLKQKGYSGDTMGERLKKAEPDLSNRNGVWQAHKLRNSIAHEMEFDVVATHAKEALTDFKRGLKDLGAL